MKSIDSLLAEMEARFAVDEKEVARFEADFITSSEEERQKVISLVISVKKKFNISSSQTIVPLNYGSKK